jgi:uroporphyrin-III C-methyltransferase
MPLEIQRKKLLQMIHPLFSSHKKPTLTLVGAGPGDPELITLKAIKALKAADIVLYDALVSDEILDFIPEETPTLCVGKRAGKHSYKQEEINELIVESAKVYGHVVRLKGGDPFVFGRATEEIEAAEANRIDVHIVPGISSALGVPASQHIPVTSRGVSESFWVITGTTKEGKLSSDIALAAKSTATVVVLMGLNKLQEIMVCFEQERKSDTPVAIIQNGTLKNEKVTVGTVATIAMLALVDEMGSPAIIVVGDVVRFSKESKKELSEVYSQLSNANISSSLKQ